MRPVACGRGSGYGDEFSFLSVFVIIYLVGVMGRDSGSGAWIIFSTCSRKIRIFHITGFVLLFHKLG